jgi:hypothetical protein
MSLKLSVDNITARHGYTVTFTRPTAGGSYDPASGTVTGAAPLTWTGQGIYVNYMNEEVNGTSITTDDRKLMVRGTGIERDPEPGDLVDNLYQIINVRKTQSGSTVLAYVCQVRG